MPWVYSNAARWGHSGDFFYDTEARVWWRHSNLLYAWQIWIWDGGTSPDGSWETVWSKRIDHTTQWYLNRISTPQKWVFHGWQLHDDISDTYWRYSDITESWMLWLWNGNVSPDGDWVTVWSDRST